MQQSSEEGNAKIDGVIADIRMINLHLFNFIHGLKKDEGREGEKEKKLHDFHKLNLAHFQEHVKRVEDYLKRSFREMTRTKLVLSPLCFRFLRPKYKDEDFLRFENQNHGLKFILTDLEKEALLHIQIYKKVRGGRISTLALKKLEISFLNDLAHRYGDGLMWLQVLQQEGKNILEEVTGLMTGEACLICGKHLAFSPELQVYLSPTVRQCGENSKKKKAFYHESCL